MNTATLQGDGRFKVVLTDAIRFFPELVEELGGEAAALLAKAHIEPTVFDKRGSILEYRAMVNLLEISATELHCPDFGLRLAALQGGTRVMGPVGVVMKNSKTVGQALGYCAKQIHAYSHATRVRFVPNRPNHKLLVELHLLIDRLPKTAQVIEHDLLLAHLNVMDISGGAARVRQVYFGHAPISPPALYRAAFGCEVLFNKAYDGVVFDEQDLMCAVVDPDEQIYEIATSFIADHYPPGTPPIHTRVRGLINRFLCSEDCTSERVAAELCMHPRTLQRRLKAEGRTFESIKDDVRRDVALRYLEQSDLPLAQVAQKLGYAEQSVLSRSCYRWFGASPRELRERGMLGMPTHT